MKAANLSPKVQKTKKKLKSMQLRVHVSTDRSSVITQPVTREWLGLSSLPSLWLIRSICTSVNINRHSDYLTLHTKLPIDVATRCTHKCLQGKFMFSTQLRFDTQRSCAKAPVGTGTRRMQNNNTWMEVIVKTFHKKLVNVCSFIIFAVRSLCDRPWDATSIWAAN